MASSSKKSRSKDDRRCVLSGDKADSDSDSSTGGMSSDEERMIDDQLQNASDFGSDSR